MNNIIIRHPCENEVERMFDLRWKVLKEPWNQPRGSEKDERDRKENGVHHFIAVINEEIVGTARFHTCNEFEGMIKYLCVDEHYRGQNVGKALLQHIEKFSISLGIQYLKLNAQNNTLSLFEKLEYEVIGHNGIPIMGKPILKLP
ncbi:MAG: putative Galactoside O-acetyltransferase [Promethearchaeota archaeon]|nr:MAG: putative Galactoside O-acetyltransferase [Candidatus Lokiarchaeota archaeon]